MTKIKAQMTGKIPGTKLTMIRYSHYHNGKRFNLYECECGNQKKIRADHVRPDNTQSCGCMLAKNQAPEYMSKIRESPKRIPNLRAKYKSGNYQKQKPNKGKIRIEDPIGSKRYRYVTEEELTAMYYEADVA